MLALLGEGHQFCPKRAPAAGQLREDLEKTMPDWPPAVQLPRRGGWFGVEVSGSRWLRLVGADPIAERSEREATPSSWPKTPPCSWPLTGCAGRWTDPFGATTRRLPNVSAVPSRVSRTPCPATHGPWSRPAACSTGPPTPPCCR